MTVTVPDVHVARNDDAPKAHATPVTEVISSTPQHRRGGPGHYQRILVNTRTGEVSFAESTEHLELWQPEWNSASAVPRDIWKRWYPGTLFTSHGPHVWFEPVPELLAWVIDSGVRELPYLGVDQANALLEHLLPYAQELISRLFVAGDELDWSAASAVAGRQIQRLCSRHQRTAGPEVDTDLVDYADVLAKFPDLYRPQLLDLSPAKLADACENITRFTAHGHPEVTKVFGRPSADGTWVHLGVLGVRAWYRTLLFGDDPRPAIEFDVWDAGRGLPAASTITAASTDDELTAWATAEQAAAADKGWHLLGAVDAADARRAQLREQHWDRLAIVGANVADLTRRLDEARTLRHQLVADATSWLSSDSAIADRARMSRQAVHSIRTAPAGTADED